MFFFLARKYRNNISNLFEAGIFSRFFFLEHRGACLGGLALGRAHTKGIVPTPKKLWVESNETGFQSLARRSRYSIRPLKFECDCFLTQNLLKTRFGAPEPLVIWAQLHAAVSNLAVCLRAGPNRSEPSREGRASVCNRAVERRFRAISADWRF